MSWPALLAEEKPARSAMQEGSQHPSWTVRGPSSGLLPRRKVRVRRVEHRERGTLFPTELGMQVNEWTAGKVTATLPTVGLAGPTKAEIILVKADGQIASSIKVELIPAQPAPPTIVLPKEV